MSCLNIWILLTTCFLTFFGTLYGLNLIEKKRSEEAAVITAVIGIIVGVSVLLTVT